jgi:serine O-acetyltransferase
MQLLALPARPLMRRTGATPSSPEASPEALSAVEADWSREEPRRWWDPSRQLLGSIRAYARAVERGGVLGRAGQRLAVLRHRFWSVVSGADIPLNCFGLGGGLLLPHPQGVVIHPDAVVGPNCLLLQQVTLGTGPTPGTPTLGGHVDVGAGAKILGGVTIGEHAAIGANAVVISDVPAHCVAVGIPAVVKKRRAAPPAELFDSGPHASPAPSAQADRSAITSACRAPKPSR